jgi:hypothetical protein
MRHASSPSLECVGGGWRLSHGDRPLLALESPVLPDAARGFVAMQFRRFPGGIAWRLHVPRKTAGRFFEACVRNEGAGTRRLPVTLSWRHPAGTDATVRAGDGFLRAPLLGSAALLFPLLLRHPNGRFALLDCDTPGSGVQRALGLGRDGAPRWLFETLLRPVSGGGAATPWVRLFADSDPRKLAAAISGQERKGRRAALGVALGLPGNGSPAAAAFWRTPEHCADAAFAEMLRLPVDEERWLRFAPGEYATVARRSGGVWIVAALNDSHARVHTLLLDFLPPGVEFDMDGVADDQSGAPVPQDPSVLPPVGTPWTRQDKMTLCLAKHGGYVVILFPRAPQAESPRRAVRNPLPGPGRP